MPHRLRIGEILRRTVPLSRQDVNEILEDQKTTRRRFGEIALSWGLCQPEHVWGAWCEQLGADAGPIDLQSLGIDAQAAAAVPAEVAREHRIVAVRRGEGDIVVACDAPLNERCLSELRAVFGRGVKYVLTGTGQLNVALEEYYPTLRPTG